MVATVLQHSMTNKDKRQLEPIKDETMGYVNGEYIEELVEEPGGNGSAGTGTDGEDPSGNASGTGAGSGTGTGTGTGDGTGTGGEDPSGNTGGSGGTGGTGSGTGTGTVGGAVQTSYAWSAFDGSTAREGMVVGFAVSGKTWSLSHTGVLEAYGLKDFCSWRLRIGGVTLLLDGTGKVVQSTPATGWLGMTVQVVTAVMGSDTGIGTQITRSTGAGADAQHGAEVTLTDVEARDRFAIAALEVMMGRVDNADAVDDATILRLCRAAYRWAQGMMVAAADSRSGDAVPAPAPAAEE